MDPNANLAEQRRIVIRINQARDSDRRPRDNDIFRLAELVDALDEWILHGGFLPESWDRRRTVDKEKVS